MMAFSNKQYDWILFDADETIFSFNGYKGLEILFSHYNLPFTKQDYKIYQAKNKSLWMQYQKGHITAAEIKIGRFQLLSYRVNQTPLEINAKFSQIMLDISEPLEGIPSLLSSLKNEIKLGVITNGFTALQQERLEKTKLNGYFDVFVISESVGTPKPNPQIFEIALKQMGQPPKDRVLMVGDNLYSDILGGYNADIDTCWLNRNHQKNTLSITPTYTITSLSDMCHLLKKFVGQVATDHI